MFLRLGGGGGGEYGEVESRETREGWPQLTINTEAKGDSKSSNERGPSLVSSSGLSCRYQRFSFCFGCSSRPSTKNIFFLAILFQFLCPHRSASWQAVVLGRLSFMCLWLEVLIKCASYFFIINYCFQYEAFF